MSSVDYIQVKSDWSTESVSLNLNQFNASVNINKILDLLAEIATETETTIVDIGNSFLLVDAVGDQLDILGVEAGVPRTSTEDDLYRSSIILTSSTKFYSVVDEDLTNLVVSIAGGDPEPEIYSGHEKLVEVQLQVSCISQDAVIYSLSQIMPPVTQLLVVFKTGVAFGFDGDDVSVGFGTVGEEDEDENGFAAVYI